VQETSSCEEVGWYEEKQEWLETGENKRNRSVRGGLEGRSSKSLARELQSKVTA